MPNTASKKIILFFFISCILVVPSFAKESAIGFGAPFSSFKQQINPRLSYEIRAFYWDGKSYIGARGISKLRGDNQERISVGLELDYLTFSKGGVAGDGYFIYIPVIFERFFNEDWSWAADLGPALLSSKDSGLNILKSNLALAFNLGLNYYFR